VAAAGLMLSGCGGGAPATTDRAVTAPAPTPERVAVPQVARPVEVRVPRLGITAALDPLHTDRTGVLVPPRYGRAGWYAAGPEPGELGRAVIAGHVDSRSGPDVFAALRNARTGDRVVVRSADGSQHTFLVYAREEHPKADFPTARVYGGAKKQAELRLITCAGPYDRARGGYQDNLIVFARLLAT
jgi:hypothetical protein